MVTLEEQLKKVCGKYSGFKDLSQVFMNDQTNPAIIRKLLDGEPQHVIDDIINNYSQPAFREYVIREEGDRGTAAVGLLKDHYKAAVGLVEKDGLVGVLGKLPPAVEPKEDDAEEVKKLYEAHVQYVNLTAVLEKEASAATDPDRAKIQQLKTALYPQISGASKNVMRLVQGYASKMSPEGLTLRLQARRKELEGKLAKHFSKEVEEGKYELDDAKLRSYITDTIDKTPEDKRDQAYLALAEYVGG